MILFGENDPIIPLESVNALKDILANRNEFPIYEIHVHLGVGHAFLHNPGTEKHQLDESDIGFQNCVTWVKNFAK